MLGLTVLLCHLLICYATEFTLLDTPLVPLVEHSSDALAQGRRMLKQLSNHSPVRGKWKEGEGCMRPTPNPEVKVYAFLPCLRLRFGPISTPRQATMLN
jgi:hypothetical protein